MLTYMEVHLYFLIPPILILGALYYPLFGRRDGLKILWLGFMATIWTTPWDNWIISQGAWSYPPGSVLYKIWNIPIEEHMFFILQPIFLILLHSIISHPDLIPFRIPRFILESRQAQSTLDHGEATRKTRSPVVQEKQKLSSRKVQTLQRRPFATLIWAVLWCIGALIVNDTHKLINLEDRLSISIPTVLKLGKEGFYLGWIIVWITPVIGFLTFLGARYGRAEKWTWLLGSGWLCLVDTIAIRNGAWSISGGTSLDYQIWRGLPIEEFLFFLLTTHLILLSTQLISHLHTLLLLSPTHPPCPPINPIKHISLLFEIALNPPAIDEDVLIALITAEETLRKGSKSFDVAKLAFGREMRIGLVAIYAWCRVTDDLIDNPSVSTSDAKETLSAIRDHVQAAYDPTIPDPAIMLNNIRLSAEASAAFHLFASLIPRLVPIQPFLELCSGYETDLKFLPCPTSLASSGVSPFDDLVSRRDITIEDHLPIKTTQDLLKYADDVAGSIASAICYLSWSILSSGDSHHRFQPVNNLKWSKAIHSGKGISLDRRVSGVDANVDVILKAREMGRALQLVNIARDIAKDARIGRLYIPRSSFLDLQGVWNLLDRQNINQKGEGEGEGEKYGEYDLPLLDTADSMRIHSEPAINKLPRTARGGTRAMVASYFEIAEEIRRQNGRIDERGIKVNKGKRVWAAVKAIWEI